MEKLAFLIVFVVTVGSACLVAFSRNLIYSAFALIGTFIGVAATFVLLSSEFLGLAQIMIYAGGILVLTIFAVMLTAKIETKGTNPVSNNKLVLPVILVLIVFLFGLIRTDKWAKVAGGVGHEATTASIGHALLTQYALPFEIVSVVLLVSMVGAAIITRRHVKES